MQDAFICDAVRTPFGRYGGGLYSLRADDLGALPIQALMQRHPALLLSNSLGTDHGMWQPQVAALAQHFFVVRYDTRGHGQSAAPQGPYTLAQLGHDVLDLMDHLDLSQVDFCGLSMGGVIGQWLGVHAGQRLRRLVLCNTAAKIGHAEAWHARAAAVRADGLDAIADSAHTRWFTEAWTQQHPETVQAMANVLRQGSPEGYASCCEALADADLRQDIGRITVPTLIVAGGQDPVTTEADARAMQADIAGAQVAVLPASHISNVEAPEAFTQVLLDFLTPAA